MKKIFLLPILFFTVHLLGQNQNTFNGKQWIKDTTRLGVLGTKSGVLQFNGSGAGGSVYVGAPSGTITSYGFSFPTAAPASNGYVMKFNTDGTTTFAAESGGGGALSGLSDVNIVSPTNLQLLQYQTSDNKWHNNTIDFSRLAIYPCKYATDAALSTNTYNNGTSGVTAQLTATANGALSVDGNTPLTGDTVLIKNEATASHNGIYRVDQPGNGGAPYILTRATYFDQSAEILTGSTTFITNGTANANRSYTMNQTGTITVGTTDITWVQTGGASGGGMADPGSNGMLARTALNVTAARTLTGTTNKIVVTNGDGSGNPTFNVGSDIVDKTASNTYTAGAKQIFDADATSADIGLTGHSADPSTLSDGDIWYRTDIDLMKYRANGTSRTLVNTDEAQTLSSKTLSSPTITSFSSFTNGGTITNPTVTGTIPSYVDGTTASSATPTPSGDARINKYDVTALAADATVGAPSGTPVNHNELILRIKDNGTARLLSWNAIYRASSDLALPTTTVINKTMYLRFEYNNASSTWDFIGYLNNF